MEFVKIRHPDIESDAECPLSALPHWEGHGWRRVDIEMPPVVVELSEPVPETPPARTPRAPRRATTEE